MEKILYEYNIATNSLNKTVQRHLLTGRIATPANTANGLFRWVRYCTYSPLQLDDCKNSAASIRCYIHTTARRTVVMSIP